jgi:ribose transport system substrate-binding protein
LGAARPNIEYDRTEEAVVRLASLRHCVRGARHSADKADDPGHRKDMTSPYWRAVHNRRTQGRSRSRRQLVALGAQSQIRQAAKSTLEKAVASNPRDRHRARTIAALGKPIDEAAKKVKIIGIESPPIRRRMTSLWRPTM